MSALPLDAAALDDMKSRPDRWYGWSDAEKSALMQQSRAALTLRDELAECRAALHSEKTQVFDLRAKLAQAEQERDSQQRVCIQAMARERELREALAVLIPDMVASDQEHVRALLARPADAAALREMLREAMDAVRESVPGGIPFDVDAYLDSLLGGGK